MSSHVCSGRRPARSSPGQARHPSTIPLPGRGGAHPTSVTSGGQRGGSSSALPLALAWVGTHRNSVSEQRLYLHLILSSRQPFRMRLILASAQRRHNLPRAL